jgi:hypothetical protein
LKRIFEFVGTVTFFGMKAVARVFQLDLQGLGAVGLRKVPPPGLQKNSWDGIAIVLLESSLQQRENETLRTTLVPLMVE